MNPGFVSSPVLCICILYDICGSFLDVRMTAYVPNICKMFCPKTGRCSLNTLNLSSFSCLVFTLSETDPNESWMKQFRISRRKESSLRSKDCPVATTDLRRRTRPACCTQEETTTSCPQSSIMNYITTMDQVPRTNNESLVERIYAKSTALSVITHHGNAISNDVADSVTIIDRYGQVIKPGDIVKSHGIFTLVVYIGGGYGVYCDRRGALVKKSKLDVFRKYDIKRGRCKFFSKKDIILRAKFYVGRLFEHGRFRFFDFSYWVYTGLTCRQGMRCGFFIR